VEDELPRSLYKQMKIAPLWRSEVIKIFVGQTLVIAGSATSIVGALANNLLLDHLLAMQIWQVSNLLLVMWAIGFWRRWWTNGIGAIALIVMYSTFFISNEIGLYWM
jgi:hypothetical protein